MVTPGDHGTEDAPHWTEPGAWPVAPGVTRIPLPLPMDGLRSVNVYVLETDEGLTLIDGGWAIPEARKQLDASLADLGHGVADIRGFLVTHVHRDHYTQAAAVRREVGSHVSLGIGEQASMDLMHDETLETDPNLSRLERCGATQLVDDWRSMMPAKRPSLEYYERPDTWLERDHELHVGTRTLQAVATPGHTQGHYVFADESASLMFAGDHVLPQITPSIGFEPAYVDQPLRDFLDSLAKVRAMPDMMLLPAHGPVTTSVHARVDELVVHHDERLDLCAVAVEDGRTTAWEVADALPWTRHARALRDLDPFNSVLACFETLAHLELLSAQQRVARDGSEPAVRFAPAHR